MRPPAAQARMLWGSESTPPTRAGGPLKSLPTAPAVDSVLTTGWASPQDHQLAPVPHRPGLSSEEKPLFFLKDSQGSTPRAPAHGRDTAPRVQPARVCTTHPVLGNRLTSTATQTRLPSRDANSTLLMAHFRRQKEQVTINTR